MSDFTDTAPMAREAVVHGRVQGVFFRDSTRRVAVEAGVTGWVRNEPDGSVAVHVEGSLDDVERVLEWLHIGPPSAQVERVDVRRADLTGADSFDVVG